MPKERKKELYRVTFSYGRVEKFSDIRDARAAQMNFSGASMLMAPSGKVLKFRKGDF